MAELLDIVEGWTKELGPFTLRADGTAYDLTGMTVRLFLRGKGLTVFNPSGSQVRIDADPTTGQVYFSPLAADFRALRSPYTIRWEVTDQAGKVVFFTNREADTISVHQP